MSEIYVQQSHCKLHLEDNQVIICSDDQKRLACLPEMQIERVVVVGNAQLTTPLIKRCLSRGIEILFTTEGGHYLGRLEAPGSYTREREIRQVRLFSDSATCLAWSKAMIEAKFQGTLVEVRRLVNNRWISEDDSILLIQKLKEQVAGTGSLVKLMGLEAMCAKEYYRLFAKALPPGMPWCGRKRQPPPDPVNSLLSLTSAFLTQRLVSGCHRCGLDCGTGFLHAFGYNRPGLALDLLEMLRCLVADHFVLKVLRRGVLAREHFVFAEGACRLTPAGFKEFTSAFDEDQNTIGKRQKSPATLMEMVLEATRQGIDTGQIPDYESLLPLR